MRGIEEHIEGMLSYKESLGYSKRSYEGFLNDFSIYLKEHHGEAAVLTMDMTLPWCTKRESEQNSGFRRRMVVLREFTKYLYAIGASSFIFPTGYYPKPERYTPYVFSDKELSAIFCESDNEDYDRNAPLRHIIIAVIYRLIYLCGLRPNEGRELKISDVDLDEGTLLIRKNKSHRERLIPMSADVAALCKSYIDKAHAAFRDTEYLFPSPTGKPYSSKWLTKRFLRLWNNVKPAGCRARVRVYDLRHRYATAILMKWADEGADLYAMLPYLSSYMGHANFKDTAYYIHLLPENLLRCPSVDWARLSKSIPEVLDEV
jgi:integrase